MHSLVNAERSEEWTQARVLYASYLRQAGDFGHNNLNRSFGNAELATEPLWGRMMGQLYMKRRQSGGNYYSAKLKRDA